MNTPAHFSAWLAAVQNAGLDRATAYTYWPRSNDLTPKSKPKACSYCGRVRQTASHHSCDGCGAEKP